MTFVVLPAVDIAAGRSVHRLHHAAGGASDNDALAAALHWQSEGASWLHVVDVDAAFGRGANTEVITQIVGRLDIDVEVSGGIADEGSVDAALATGAARIVLSTAALRETQWVGSVVSRVGERLAVALDVRGDTLAPRGASGSVGPLRDALVALEAAGCRRYVVTDVERDGAMSGPNLELVRAVCAATDRPVIASGGVAGSGDLAALAELAPLGVEGAVVGRALYAGTLTLAEALAAVAVLQ